VRRSSHVVTLSGGELFVAQSQGENQDWTHDMRARGRRYAAQLILFGAGGQMQ
jgi:hypothetical protein